MAPSKESPLQAVATVVRERRTGTLRLTAGKTPLELRFENGTCLNPETAPQLASLPPPVDTMFEPATEPIPAGKGLHGLRLLISATTSMPPASLDASFPEPANDSAIVTDPKLFKEIESLLLDPEERGLLNVVANNRTAADIFESSFLPRERLRALLVAYELFGLVRFESAGEIRRKAYQAGLSPQDHAVREEVRKFAERLPSTSYYQWVGVSTKAGPAEIQKQATILLEKYAKPSLEKAFQDDRSADLKALLAAIPEACSVLVHPGKRSEYDAYLASGRTGSFAGQSTVLRAEAEKASGTVADALAVYEKALSGAVAPVAVVTSYVRTLLRSPEGASPGNREKALQQLRRALASSPDEPDLYLAAGEWCEAFGQTDKAAEAYQRAFQLDPALSIAREAIRRLKPEKAPKIILTAIQKNLGKLNHYQLLGVDPKAGETQVHAAFRELSKRFHPDRFFHDEDRALPELAKEVYKRIVDAFMVLKSSEKRRSYDRTLDEISRQAGPSS